MVQHGFERHQASKYMSQRYPTPLTSTCPGISYLLCPLDSAIGVMHITGLLYTSRILILNFAT